MAGLLRVPGTFTGVSSRMKEQQVALHPHPGQRLRSREVPWDMRSTHQLPQGRMVPFRSRPGCVLKCSFPETGRSGVREEGGGFLASEASLGLMHGLPPSTPHHGPPSHSSVFHLSARRRAPARGQKDVWGPGRHNRQGFHRDAVQPQTQVGAGSTPGHAKCGGRGVTAGLGQRGRVGRPLGQISRKSPSEA